MEGGVGSEIADAIERRSRGCWRAAWLDGRDGCLVNRSLLRLSLRLHA